MTPVNGMIEIEQLKLDEVSPGGLILPKPEDSSSRLGRVINLPLKHKKDTPSLVPKDAIISFHVSAVREVLYMGQHHFFVHENQVIAFVLPEVQVVN